MKPFEIIQAPSKTITKTIDKPEKTTGFDPHSVLCSSRALRLLIQRLHLPLQGPQLLVVDLRLSAPGGAEWQRSGDCVDKRYILKERGVRLGYVYVFVIW